MVVIATATCLCSNLDTCFLAGGLVLALRLTYRLFGECRLVLLALLAEAERSDGDSDLERNVCLASCPSSAASRWT